MAQAQRNGTVRSAQENAAQQDTSEPIILNLGKKTRRQIRKLTKGKPGRLMNRVEDAIDHLRSNGSMADGAQPVVIVIKQRAKRKRRRLGKLWGL